MFVKNYRWPPSDKPRTCISSSAILRLISAMSCECSTSLSLVSTVSSFCCTIYLHQNLVKSMQCVVISRNDVAIVSKQVHRNNKSSSPTFVTRSAIVASSLSCVCTALAASSAPWRLCSSNSSLCLRMYCSPE